MSELVVQRPKQWEVLASPVRLEVVETLELYGPCSVAEVAAELGRTPHSLYHHFRLLLAAGLVEEVDSRRSGAREEAVYSVCGRPVVMPFDASTARARRQRTKVARHMLRQAERDYEAAVEEAAGLPELRPEVRRHQVRLRESSIDKIRAHLDAIGALVLEERLRASDDAPDARWISWLSLLAPRA